MAFFIFWKATYKRMLSCIIIKTAEKCMEQTAYLAWLYSKGKSIDWNTYTKKKRLNLHAQIYTD